MWVEHLWEQPPSAVRRAKLDLTLHAKIAIYARRRSKIRQMRARPWKDAADWHKSGVKQDCRSAQLSLLTEATDGKRKMLFPQSLASNRATACPQRSQAC